MLRLFIDNEVFAPGQEIIEFVNISPLFDSRLTGLVPGPISDEGFHRGPGRRARSRRRPVYSVPDIYAYIHDLGTVSARVPDELEAEIEVYLEEENLDRSTAVRKPSIGGLEDWFEGRFFPDIAL
jgi:hypothetical protein